MSPNVLNLPRIAGLRSAVVAAAHLLAVLGSCDLCLRFSCVLVPFETMQAYGASPEIIYEGKPFKEVRRHVVILFLSSQNVHLMQTGAHPLRENPAQVDWFKLVDKEIDIVSRVTNEEIRRVRNGLAQVLGACRIPECVC